MPPCLEQPEADEARQDADQAADDDLERRMADMLELVRIRAVEEFIFLQVFDQDIQGSAVLAEIIPEADSVGDDDQRIDEGNGEERGTNP